MSVDDAMEQGRRDFHNGSNSSQNPYNPRSLSHIAWGIAWGQENSKSGLPDGMVRISIETDDYDLWSSVEGWTVKEVQHNFQNGTYDSTKLIFMPPSEQS